MIYKLNSGKTFIAIIPLLFAIPAYSQTPISNSPNLDLNPEIRKNSPVLQRWQQKIPNVLEEINNTPSFPTRVRLGYSGFPSTGQAGGWNVGIEDIFLDRTPVTLSADYQTSFNGKRTNTGAELRYYLRPLGNYINVAPVLGYRYLESDRHSTSGLNAGLRLVFVPSRGGAADIALSQTWVAPTTNEQVSITTLSVGYAVTRNLRIATDLQKQNSRQYKDSRVGIVLEWMP